MSTLVADVAPLVAQQIATSPEYFTKVVNGLFATILHRPADPAGLSTYVSFLANGGKAEDVEAILAGSAEYFQRRGGGRADVR